MTVKVLVTALGQQIVADTKQIENKDTSELVGYWMNNPRVVVYQQNEEGSGVSVNFANYCMVSDEASFSIRAEHVVAILEPRADVVEAYTTLIVPTDTEATIEGEAPLDPYETYGVNEDDATNLDTVEGLSDVPDSAE